MDLSFVKNFSAEKQLVIFSKIKDTNKSNLIDFIWLNYELTYLKILFIEQPKQFLRVAFGP